MSAQYVIKKMPDLQGNGEEVTYPQMVMTGQTSTRELAEYIALKCAFPKGITEGVISELSDALVHEMAMGRSVKIEGIGVFTPTLALRADKEREETQEGATHRNAQSIAIGNVNFRADKELIADTNQRCRLERAGWTPKRSSQKHTPEQRLSMVREYLDEHPYINVRAYCQLTGLLQTAATVELRKWAYTSGTGIDADGFGSHKVYVKRKE